MQRNIADWQPSAATLGKHHLIHLILALSLGCSRPRTVHDRGTTTKPPLHRARFFYQATAAWVFLIDPAKSFSQLHYSLNSSYPVFPSISTFPTVRPALQYNGFLLLYPLSHSLQYISYAIWCLLLGRNNWKSISGRNVAK